MSHVTKIGLKVRDLDALETACRALGLELRRDQKTYAWWGTYAGDSHAYGDHDPKTFGHGEHAIGVPGVTPRNGGGGDWEIGVVRAKDGDGYDLLCDLFGTPGRKLQALAGPGLHRLKQEYAAANVTARAHATLARKGFTLHREQLEGGRVRLRAVRR